MGPSPFRSDQSFANADSFAQSFDEAWAAARRRPADRDLDSATLLERMLDQLADHPFVVSEPQLARQVAEFRIRLLGL